MYTVCTELRSSNLTDCIVTSVHATGDGQLWEYSLYSYVHS